MLSFRTPRRALIAGLVACLGFFLAPGTAVASAEPAPPGTAAASAQADTWSASYRSASTAGTWWYDYIEGSSPNDMWDVVFEGQLTNTGSGCYSTWFMVTFDLNGPPPVKAGTRCGTGTSPVRYSFPSYGWSPTANVYVFVCKGSTNTDDCGPVQWISTVWW